MATTMFFEEKINDQGGTDSLELEFGRSSYYSENSLYIVINGNGVIVDRKTAKRIADAMASCASYLALDQIDM